MSNSYWIALLISLVVLATEMQSSTYTAHIVTSL